MTHEPWIEDVLRNAPSTLSIDETAQVTRVCRRTVERWISSGRLKAKRIGAKVLIPRMAIADMLESAEDAS